jgi:hypothetical protein
MIFTKDVPTKDGYYWFKDLESGTICGYEVLFNADFKTNLNPSGMLVADTVSGYNSMHRFKGYEFARVENPPT